MNKEMKKNRDKLNEAKAETIINVYSMKEIQWNFEGTMFHNT